MAAEPLQSAVRAVVEPGGGPRGAGIAALLDGSPRLWRAGRAGAGRQVPVGDPVGDPAEPLGTGIAALDALLPGGGWPLGGLTEVLVDCRGIGELRLLTPALARLGRAGRWVVWLDPPYVPYAPALAAGGLPLSRTLWVDTGGLDDRLWAAEQALRHRGCGAVLAWLTGSGGDGREARVMRRLQLAAETGQSWGVLFRPTRAESLSSVAVLRLRLDVAEAGIRVGILKCRGRSPAAAVVPLPP